MIASVPLGLKKEPGIDFRQFPVLLLQLNA